MATPVYLMSLEPNSGKSLVSLGVLEVAASQVDRIGYFRPVVQAGERRDSLIETVRSTYQLHQQYDESYGVTTDQTRGMGESVPAGLLHQILSRYEALAEQCDLVVIEGTDYTGASAAFEFALNAEIASQLGAVTVLVERAHQHTVEQVRGAISAAVASLRDRNVSVGAVFINRVTDGQRAAYQRLAEGVDGYPIRLIADAPDLSTPTLAEVAEATGATLLLGEESELRRPVGATKIAAMTLPHFLTRLEPGCLVISPGDRADIFLASMATPYAADFPSVSGLLLSGGFTPDDVVMTFAQALREQRVPVLATRLDTFQTAAAVAEVRGRIEHGDERRTAEALRLFEAAVDSEELWQWLNAERSAVTTPLMFERRLVAAAKAAKQRIVLPEGEDDRILQAADLLLRRDVCELVILGDPAVIAERCDVLGLDLAGADIVDPATSPLRKEFADLLYELRRHKGMTRDVAYDQVADVSWFGTMLVHTGRVGGMVSGAAHTTADTVRPALQIIRTSPEVSVVSSVFLMALPDKVLVYGDCAVVPDPDSVQLADIAISSAGTAQQFGIDPYVALLSYSTGASGSGADVEKVAAATDLVRERRPDLLVEGPIQYDAAVVPSVAASKLPGSPVAGRATVLVFPDLNTGNNTYKAVQRSAGALAIGPVLQGLRLPVNDLSRGATVDDIVNTVVITALQAVPQADTEEA
jgi:phosphate acetyltransferase